MSKILYQLARAILILFVLACALAVIGALALMLAPLVGATGCPIGWPECRPDYIVVYAPAFLPAVLR